jgi:bifunctional non-homologous end joining protein LigD
VKSSSAASARWPDFVEPMKAKIVGSMPPGDWIYKIKFDGYRALALRGGSETRLLSRNQKDLLEVNRAEERPSGKPTRGG